MTTKEKLTSYLNQRLASIASQMFIKRAVCEIEQAPDDKDSLIEASIKIRRMVKLFIDKNMAEDIFENLKKEIEKND